MPTSTLDPHAATTTDRRKKPIAAAVAITLVACGPAADLDPSGSADEASSTAGESSGDTGDDDGETNEPLPVPPPPEVLGLDPEGRWLDPQHALVRAREVARLRPEVGELRITHEVRVTGDDAQPYAYTLWIEGIATSCDDETSGELFAYIDSARPDETVMPDPAIVDAITADLGSAPRASCDAKPSSADIAPGGAQWWQGDPCPIQAEIELAAYAALLMAIGRARMVDEPTWHAYCDTQGVVLPLIAQACHDDVVVIDGELVAAIARMNNARLFEHIAYEIAVEAEQLAAQAGLGAAGLANQQDVGQLATMALRIVVYKTAADANASAAVGHIIFARVLSGYLLAGSTAPAVLSALVVLGNTWQVEMSLLTECYRRVVAWIAAAAAIGFGIRFFGAPPPGGGGLQIGPPGGSGGGEPPSVLHIGPRRIQAEAYFLHDELRTDIDALSPGVAALTHRWWGPWVTRTISAGYELPGVGHVLTQDVIGIEPLTFLPYVVAPAGATIVLGEGAYGGPSQEVPDTVYSAAPNTVYLGRIGVDLNFEQTDAHGNSVPPSAWALCLADLAPHQYCAFGLATTVPPWHIGTPLSAHWRVWAMAGIVDPRTGVISEPQGSQYFVGLHAPGEGPSSQCWYWDYGQNTYAFNPSVPGCGPGGPVGD